MKSFLPISVVIYAICKVSVFGINFKIIEENLTKMEQTYWYVESLRNINGRSDDIHINWKIEMDCK